MFNSNFVAWIWDRYRYKFRDYAKHSIDDFDSTSENNVLKKFFEIERYLDGYTPYLCALYETITVNNI